MSSLESASTASSTLDSLLDSQLHNLLCRIRSLTTILQGPKECDPATAAKENAIPDFFNHLTTLLSCGDKDNQDGAKAIAVTGATFVEGFRALVVTPTNPDATTDFAGLLKVQKIARDEDRTVDDVVEGAIDVPLQEHIKDIITVLSGLEFDTVSGTSDDFNHFCIFVVARCFRTLRARVLSDKVLRERVFNTLRFWKPPDEFDVPILKFGRGDTILHWVHFLAWILTKLDSAVKDVHQVYSSQTNVDAKIFSRVNALCRDLYFFLELKDGYIVRTLLKSVENVFRLRVTDSDKDVGKERQTDMRMEKQENMATLVLRYLKGIASWHTAIFALLQDTKTKELAKSATVGLIEVYPQSEEVAPFAELEKEYYRRFPRADVQERRDIVALLGEHYKPAFTGSVHAEAALMGIFNHYYQNNAPPLPQDVVDVPDLLRELVDPLCLDNFWLASCDPYMVLELRRANKGRAIAVSEKCCWCCQRLRELVEPKIALPGTHGILVAWNPPSVGIDAKVLEKLGDELWLKLRRRLWDRASSMAHLDHSSGTSPETLPITDMALPASEKKEEIDEATSWARYD
ncbi:unnamed protein product [Cyclocybe aegerita]|uniref:Uncharacterized protein n=1 Tax=Cyclocybe aegerita TaxID=1973307 RepID=A0A8S0WGS9_CYCAE|nr:unnamed protein product [Cyclocybe aegerita]